jgi:outer membrane protein assembly factor BamB
VGANNVGMLALDGTNHTVKWKFSTNNPPIGGIGTSNGGSPALDTTNGTIYFSGQDGNVYSIEPSCGTKNWSFTVPGISQFVAQPALSADRARLYVHAGTKLYALSSATGSMLWEADVAGGGTNVPAVTSQDLVIAVGGFGQVFAFNGTTGAQQWSFTPVGQANVNAIGIAISRTIDGDMVFYTATGSKQRLIALNAANGSMAWEFNPPMTSVINASSVIVGSNGNVIVRTLDGIVYSIK